MSCKRNDIYSDEMHLDLSPCTPSEHSSACLIDKAIFSQAYVTKLGIVTVCLQHTFKFEDFNGGMVYRP